MQLILCKLPAISTYEEAGLEELLSKESSFPTPPTLLQEDPQSNSPILPSSFRALQEELECGLSICYL